MISNELQEAYAQFSEFVTNSEAECNQIIEMKYGDSNNSLNNDKLSIQKQFDLIKDDLNALNKRVNNCVNYNHSCNLNPLEYILQKTHDLYNLLGFIKSKNMNDFFTPKINQKQNVLLDLIDRLNTLVDYSCNADRLIIFSWMELALMDLDTQDRYVKNNGRELLERILSRFSVGNQKYLNNLIYHLIRSQLADLKK